MTMTPKDFKVGQEVWVDADQRIRKGQVTRLGRTRISIRHPRNKQGDMVERPYPMYRIVLGQTPDHDGVRAIVYADGRATLVSSMHPDLPEVSGKEVTRD